MKTLKQLINHMVKTSKDFHGVKDRVHAECMASLTQCYAGNNTWITTLANHYVNEKGIDNVGIKVFFETYAGVTFSVDTDKPVGERVVVKNSTTKVERTQATWDVANEHPWYTLVADQTKTYKLPNLVTSATTSAAAKLALLGELTEETLADHVKAFSDALKGAMANPSKSDKVVTWVADYCEQEGLDNPSATAGYEPVLVAAHAAEDTAEDTAAVAA